MNHELENDGQRWKAFMTAPMPSGGLYRPETIIGTPCASCENAGNPCRMVDPIHAVVVPWSVMGDAREFAFVCDGCAAAVKDMHEMPRGILTVGVLRSLLATCSDDDHVVIGTPAEWRDVSEWLNIESVQPADGDSYQAFTLFAADTFDGRQF